MGVLEPHWVRAAEAFELFDGDEQHGVCDARAVNHYLSPFDVYTKPGPGEAEGNTAIGAHYLPCPNRWAS